MIFVVYSLRIRGLVSRLCVSRMPRWLSEILATAILMFHRMVTSLIGMDELVINRCKSLIYYNHVVCS